MHMDINDFCVLYGFKTSHWPLYSYECQALDMLANANDVAYTAMNATVYNIDGDIVIDSKHPAFIEVSFTPVHDLKNINLHTLSLPAYSAYLFTSRNACLDNVVSLLNENGMQYASSFNEYIMLCNDAFLTYVNFQYRSVGQYISAGKILKQLENVDEVKVFIDLNSIDVLDE